MPLLQRALAAKRLFRCNFKFLAAARRGSNADWNLRPASGNQETTRIRTFETSETLQRAEINYEAI
jgi:hypothetical protein